MVGGMQSGLLDHSSTAVYNQPVRIPTSSAQVGSGCACFRHAVVMLYCAAMVDLQGDLPRLLEQLRGTSLGRILAVLMEAAGPLAPIGAQAIYTLSPLLGEQSDRWDELGATLEDPASLDSFIQALREPGGEDC